MHTHTRPTAVSRIIDFIIPDWPQPSGVKALFTTRRGGVSAGKFDSLNLGLQVGDDPLAVLENRRRLGAHLPANPLWLNQVHGTDVLVIDRDVEDATPPTADAVATALINRPCAVLVADCLPILFCDEAGTCIAAAHAGWRGLASGVIERTVAAMPVLPRALMAWLGPAIGPSAFEVGQDVVDAFCRADIDAKRAFAAIPQRDGKYLADIHALARQRLARAGVEKIYGGGFCTVTSDDQFFSYRRDGQTGRMAAVIWRE